MNDSHWIAQLHRFGLIRASFSPEDKFQQLRLLSRHRTNLTDDLAHVKSRVQRILEDGNIKIGSVVSDVFGVAGLNVLRLLADDVTTADRLAAQVTKALNKLNTRPRKCLGFKTPLEVPRKELSKLKKVAFVI